MSRTIFLFLAVLLSAGCSKPEPAVKVASRKIHEWVPVHASPESVRKIMEEHHFVCSLEDYTNSQVVDANDGKMIGRKFSFKGQEEVATNVCYLNCVSHGSDVLIGQARFTFINQKYIRLFLSEGSPKN
jgi:hypothetical protein